MANTREQERSEIAEHVEQYMRAGGVITRCDDIPTPRSVSSIGEMDEPYMYYQPACWMRHVTKV